MGAPDAGTFVAFSSHFSGFRSWPSMPGVAPGAPQPPEAGDGGIHPTHLTTYISARPPAGSTAFPVGTLIVKEPGDEPLATRRSFAMVKRGGGYNVTGARDWEWFELSSLDEETVSIAWRGFGPPNGESYGGSPTVCNDCHALNAANDYVWTQGLKL